LATCRENSGTARSPATRHISFLRDYLAAAGDAAFVPRSAAGLAALLDGSMLARALYELVDELNNRPDRARIPLRGILVESRRRHRRQVGLPRLLVALAVPAGMPVAQELRPGLLGLADENDVGQVAEVVLPHGHPRATDDGEEAAPFQPGAG
jgi:hypothetical protein